MTEKQKQRLKDLTETINSVERRIGELEIALKSDVIRMRNRLDMQQTLQTNRDLLKALKDLQLKG